MYLHYYYARKYCGQVDSDLVFNYPTARAFVVVSHDQRHTDMLEAFKLVHGKEIKVISPALAYDMHVRNLLPIEVFTTKSAGTRLTWVDGKFRLCI